MKLNTPDRSVSLTKEILHSLIMYSHNVHDILKEPKNLKHQLLLFSLQSFIEKLYAKMYKNLHEQAQKPLKIKINHAERITMSIAFETIKIPADLHNVQFQIINNLILMQ